MSTPEPNDPTSVPWRSEVKVAGLVDTMVVWSGPVATEGESPEYWADLVNANATPRAIVMPKLVQSCPFSCTPRRDERTMSVRGLTTNVVVPGTIVPVPRGPATDPVRVTFVGLIAQAATPVATPRAIDGNEIPSNPLAPACRLAKICWRMTLLVSATD
jgi:hypothetical protein